MTRFVNACSYLLFVLVGMFGGFILWKTVVASLLHGLFPSVMADSPTLTSLVGLVGGLLTLIHFYAGSTQFFFLQDLKRLHRIRYKKVLASHPEFMETPYLLSDYVFCAAYLVVGGVLPWVVGVSLHLGLGLFARSIFIWEWAGIAALLGSLLFLQQMIHLVVGGFVDHLFSVDRLYREVTQGVI